MPKNVYYQGKATKTLIIKQQKKRGYAYEIKSYACEIRLDM